MRNDCDTAKFELSASTGTTTTLYDAHNWEYHWFETLNSKPVISRPKMAVFKGYDTYVIWSDGSKTSATWVGGEDEAYDPEDAVALCVAYKVFGTKSAFRKFVSNGKFQMSKEEKQEIKAYKKKQKLMDAAADSIRETMENAVDQSTEDEFPF